MEINARLQDWETIFNLFVRPSGNGEFSKEKKVFEIRCCIIITSKVLVRSCLIMYITIFVSKHFWVASQSLRMLTYDFCVFKTKDSFKTPQSEKNEARVLIDCTPYDQ